MPRNTTHIPHSKGPSCLNYQRVMRTAFFLVWVSRKHSEQVARQHGK